MSGAADEKTTAERAVSYITEKDLRLELKAFRLEVRLLIVLGLVLSRVHLPDAVTAGSVLGVIGLVALKSALTR